MKLWNRLARLLWHSVVGKLWATIMLLVAVVLLILGVFLLQYIDIWFDENSSHAIKVLFIITAIIGFLLSTFFAFFLSAKIQQPLLQLKNAADSVSQGDYSTRIHISSSDEIGQLAITFNNMTEQLDKLIHALNHEKNHLSSILRSMGDSVITFDSEGQVILTNPSGQLLISGWSSLESAWEQEPMEDVPFFPGVPMPLRQLFQHVMKDGKDLTEKVHVHSSVWSVVMAPLQSGNVIRGAVAVIRNVTEEHKLDKLRRDFVANISHEIRTPLSMLQGYSEALLDDIVASPEERRELVQVIHDESLRMGRLVNDFLDIARMEAGHVEMNFQEIELGLVVRRVHRKFQVYAKEREVALHVKAPEDKLLTLMQADEDRLEQVLTNLMDNALRHTPAGKSITIAAENLLVSGEPYIQLKISDEGVGIPPEDVPYIFERFYKADKARKRTGGTGLGLAIVKNLIELHHGKIQVDSTAATGTTFTILLPVEGKE
ncbi:HAMP domain-containing sensor histidine kinase [Paenibacillus paeoniae]|uniref:histidine kinase n=1 Tax=Paenibacillus paeoniae TaxID=2292705 RepID=A0A371PND7_9BACL|nr:ATP-binding protein [Paenibacillus paeoniae]REK77287.1 HAMP domain-containing protein [Paenibacillus paeoniae]